MGFSLLPMHIPLWVPMARSRSRHARRGMSNIHAARVRSFGNWGAALVGTIQLACSSSAASGGNGGEPIVTETAASSTSAGGGGMAGATITGTTTATTGNQRIFEDRGQRLRELA